MRLRGDIDQKVLSDLFYQYLNIEEDFIKSLFIDGETQLGRIFVNEPVVSAENALLVMDYERSTEVIKSASHIGVGLCYCRHKMEHLGVNDKTRLDRHVIYCFITFCSALNLMESPVVIDTVLQTLHYQKSRAVDPGGILVCLCRRVIELTFPL